MSALCQKQTFCTAANSPLFNYLVGSHLHDERHGKTELLGGLEVNHELEFGGLYDRQIARLLALENPTRVHTNLAIGICNAGPVAYQTPCRGILAHSIARRQSIPCRQRDDLIPMGERERAARNNQRTNSSWDKGFKRRLDFAGVRGTQNNELLPDCSRRNLHVFSVLGVVQRLEHANSRRRGHKLTQLLQSFRPYRGSEKAYACDVTARPI